MPQHHTLTSLASSRHLQSGSRRRRLCRRPCMRKPMRRVGPCNSSSSMRLHQVSIIYSWDRRNDACTGGYAAAAAACAATYLRATYSGGGEDGGSNACALAACGHATQQQALCMHGTDHGRPCADKMYAHVWPVSSRQGRACLRHAPPSATDPYHCFSFCFAATMHHHMRPPPNAAQ